MDALTSCQDALRLLDNRLIVVNTSPDITGCKPVAIFKKEEVGKLLRQFEIMRETWFAFKFNSNIFIVWKDLIFLYLDNSSNAVS